MFKKQVTQVTQNGGECRSQKGNSGSADEGTGEPDAAARHGGVRKQRVRVGSDAGIHLVEPLGRHVVEVGHAAGRVGADVAVAAPALEGHAADEGRQRQKLLLAGDIGYLGDDNYSKHPFWNWASENYKEVHCCMGNHEFYKYYDVATLPDGYLLEIRSNVFSHYNGIVRMGDTDIILSTLWSRIPLEDAYYTEQVISDFHRILYKGELMTYSQFNAEHERCITFIKEAVAHSQAAHKIVVTHHVPSFRMLHPKFQGSKANGAFTVELEDYIAGSDIDYWIYGHT